jgi:HEAT repeat protein
MPRIAVAMALGAGAVGGCTLAPRKFAHVDNPAPLVRARALTLGDNVPDAEAIPVLLQSLDDPDHVVRMTANEELKRRTGQDFGFQPWAEPEQRRLARQRWQSWFDGSTPEPGGAPR